MTEYIKVFEIHGLKLEAAKVISYTVGRKISKSIRSIKKTEIFSTYMLQ